MNHKMWIIIGLAAVVLAASAPKVWNCFLRPWVRGCRALEAGDHARAMRLFQKASAGGEANADFDLAVMHQFGKGVKADPVEAARLFETAAVKGDPWAMMCLSGKHEHGDGVPRSPVQAYRWILLATAPDYIRPVVDSACVQRCRLELALTPAQMAKARALAGVEKLVGSVVCRCRDDAGVPRSP